MTASGSAQADPSNPFDHVDGLRDQWERELPDLDTSPMEVLGRIRRVAMLASPAIEAALAAHGLDRGEFDVLGSLRRSGAPWRLTPTELYRSLLVSSGSLTHRLGRLESAGLVSREPSPTDGRSKLVQLTTKGRHTVERAFREDMQAEAALLEALSRDEREALAGHLRSLLQVLETRLRGVAAR